MDMNIKKWYQSKLVWLGILLTISGIIPVVNELLHNKTPDVSAVITAIGGMITVIIRIWFTSATIAR